MRAVADRQGPHPFRRAQGRVQHDGAADGFTQQMRPLHPGRIHHREQIIRQPVHIQLRAGIRAGRLAVAAHVETQDTKLPGQHRQPAGEDVLAGADAMMQQDRFRLGDPGRRQVGQ